MSRAEPTQDAIDQFVIKCHFDLPGVQAALAEQPALLNARSSLDETPLAAAAHVGNKAIAEYLLNQGASMELPAAAMLGRDDDVRGAVDGDPSLANAAGAHGISILFHAAVGGNFDLARYLVDRGATVTPESGGHVLHAAVRAGDADMVRWLIDLGADINTKDFESKTPLQRAREAGHAEIAALLGEGGAA
jgi:ankyrin repeat protein